MTENEKATRLQESMKNAWRKKKEEMGRMSEAQL